MANKESQQEIVASKPESESFVRRKIREMIRYFRPLTDPESLIGNEDMQLFRYAKYNKEEIGWIARVKKESRERQSQDAKPRPFYAYDLVRVHAMLARDQFRRGNNYISSQTEKYLENLIMYIGEKSIHDGSQFVYFYKRNIGRLHSPDDKASFLQNLITIIHSRGDAEILDIFTGYPVLSDSEFKTRDSGGMDITPWNKKMMSQRIFLSQLNNLGERSQQEVENKK